MRGRPFLFGLFVLLAGCGGVAAPGSGEVASSSTEAERQYRDAVTAASWGRLANAPSINGKQDDLYFVTPEVGWSVNGQGRIFRTEDGGASWTKLVEQPGTFFRSIMMVSPTRGFAGNIGPGYFPGVTDPEPLYETSDRGTTWTPVRTVTGPQPTGICNMQRLDERHLFAVGRVGETIMIDRKKVPGCSTSFVQLAPPSSVRKIRP